MTRSLSARITGVFTLLTAVCWFSAEAAPSAKDSSVEQGNPLLHEVLAGCNAKRLGITQKMIDDRSSMDSALETDELKSISDIKKFRALMQSMFDVAEKKSRCVEAIVLKKIGPDTTIARIASGQEAKPVFTQLKKAIASLKERLEKLKSPEQECASKSAKNDKATDRCMREHLAMATDLGLTGAALDETDKLTALNEFNRLPNLKMGPKVTLKNAIDALVAHRKAQFDWSMQENERGAREELKRSKTAN